jgi:hypothetical protein
MKIRVTMNPTRNRRPTPISRRATNRLLLFFGVISSVVGIASLVFGISAAVGNMDLLSVGKRAEGTVIRVESVRTEVDRTYRDASGNERTRRETVYRPVSTVSFRAEDERMYEFTAGSISESESMEHRIGKKVDVIYDPAKPQDASKDNAWAQWQPPLLISLAGLTFFVGGVILFRLVIFTRPSGEVNDSAIQNSRGVKVLDTAWVLVWNVVAIPATIIWLTQSRLEATWQYVFCLVPAALGGLMMLPGLVLMFRRKSPKPEGRRTRALQEP